MSDRAIRISYLEVIFDEHHTGSFFQDESLWSKTSFFQSFDERSTSLRVHIEEKYIISDSIESLSIIGIDGDISSEELSMILGLDRDITRFEDSERFLCDFSGADFIQDDKQRIFSISDSRLSIHLAKLRRKNTWYELRLSPDRMLESILNLTHPTGYWWQLEKISNKYDLYTSERIERKSYRTKKAIEICEKPTTHHRYLIDHQN